MTDFATRCPHCQTSFQVSESQLSAASGLVRCGSCLNIFNAADNWIDIDLEDYNEAQQVLPLEDDTEELDDEDSEDFLFDIEPLITEDDELDEIRLLEDIARTNAGLLSRRIIDAESHRDDDESEPDSWEALEPEKDIELLLAEDDAVAAPPDGDEKSFSFETLALEEDDLGQRLEPPARRASRTALWLPLSVLAAAGLGAQYIYYQFDELAQSEYRPWLEKLCQHAPCQLPAVSRLDLLESRELMVRAHPEQDHALRVDTLLYNKATSPQAFPVLELRFSDLNGDLLAARRFQPEDYLAGELSAESLMPARQPLHISLEIADPGDTAVNFQVRLLPPGTE